MSISVQNSLGHRLMREQSIHNRHSPGPAHHRAPPTTGPCPLQDSALYRATPITGLHPLHDPALQMAPPSAGLQPEIIKAI